MSAADHLERHLGPMERGWASSNVPGVQVCLFPDQPFKGAFTLATLGLSNTVLTLGGGREVRQELLLGCLDARQVDDLAKLLFAIAELVLTAGQALLRGQVIPLGERIVDSSANALYASIPVVFPEGLETIEDSTPATVVVWLVPLMAPETALVSSVGWSEFEVHLESADPPLFDLHRVSSV